MGVKLGRQSINLVLATADHVARKRGEELVAVHPDWSARIQTLSSDDCPVTYLPVLGCLLVARSMFPASQLNVLHIQAQTSDLGYSASSIGSLLLPFSTQQGVNLRTRSTQVLNSQPFTYKPMIVPGMAASKFETQFKAFYDAAVEVQDMTQDQAAEILAVLFHLRRRDALAAVAPVVRSGITWSDVCAFTHDVAKFVEEHSESGKVGQVLAASVLASAYPNMDVRMGNNNDPSSKVPGDVQLSSDARRWLWCEVKQVVVGDTFVEDFIEKVSDIGGDRALYFALANGPYPQNINREKMVRAASKKNVALQIVSSPSEALAWYVTIAPGDAATVAEMLADSFGAFLAEAEVTTGLRETWQQVVIKHLE